MVPRLRDGQHGRIRQMGRGKWYRGLKPFQFFQVGRGVSLRTTNRLMTSLTQVTLGTWSAPMCTDNHSNSASHFLLPTPHQSLLRPWTPNLKTINLSLPQPTPHLTTSTTPLLIMTVGTQLDNQQSHNPITHKTTARQNADECGTHDHAWCSLLLTQSGTPPIYLSFSVIWPSFPLLCNKGIFYFSFLFYLY